LEQHLASVQMLRMAKRCEPLQFISANIREHRIHLQNNRKFGLFAHCNAFVAAAPNRRPKINR
jgi:hypothetical protein